MNEDAASNLNAAIAEINRAIGALQNAAGVNTMMLQDIKSDLIRHFSDDKQAFHSIDERIGGLEKKVYWFSGVFAFIAFIATKLTGKF